MAWFGMDRSGSGQEQAEGTFGFHKTLGISGVAAQLVPCRVVFSCTYGGHTSSVHLHSWWPVE